MLVFAASSELILPAIASTRFCWATNTSDATNRCAATARELASVASAALRADARAAMPTNSAEIPKRTLSSCVTSASCCAAEADCVANSARPAASKALISISTLAARIASIAMDACSVSPAKSPGATAPARSCSNAAAPPDTPSDDPSLAPWNAVSMAFNESMIASLPMYRSFEVDRSTPAIPESIWSAAALSACKSALICCPVPVACSFSSSARAYNSLAASKADASSAAALTASLVRESTTMAAASAASVSASVRIRKADPTPASTSSAS